MTGQKRGRKVRLEIKLEVSGREHGERKEEVEEGVALRQDGPWTLSQRKLTLRTHMRQRKTQLARNGAFVWLLLA